MAKSRHIRIKFGEKVAIAAFAGALAGMLAANAANQLNASHSEQHFVQQSTLEQSKPAELNATIASELNGNSSAVAVAED